MSKINYKKQSLLIKGKQGELKKKKKTHTHNKNESAQKRIDFMINNQKINYKKQSFF